MDKEKYSIYIKQKWDAHREHVKLYQSIKKDAELEIKKQQDLLYEAIRKLAKLEVVKENIEDLSNY